MSDETQALHISIIFQLGSGLLAWQISKDKQELITEGL